MGSPSRDFSRLGFNIVFVDDYLECLRIVQMDNVIEYFSKPLEHFLLANGISLSIILFLTSQQNGIAERKHRAAIEGSCRLMLEIYVPNS